MVIANVFNSFSHLLHVCKTQFCLLSSTLRSECLFISLNLQKSYFVLFCWIFQQRCWDLLWFHKYFCWIQIFFSYLNSHFLQSLLINSSNITEPFSVGIDSSSFSWSLMQFFQARHFLFVHLKSFDGVGGSERVVFSISIAFNFSIGVGRSIWFWFLVKFAMKTLVVSC